MASKRVNPATRAACRARNAITATAIGSENKSTTPNLQDHRAQWLARRHALPLPMAHAIAGLAFPEREATR
jgi:hypothetical protein